MVFFLEENMAVSSDFLKTVFTQDVYRDSKKNQKALVQFFIVLDQSQKYIADYLEAQKNDRWKKYFVVDAQTALSPLDVAVISERADRPGIVTLLLTKGLSLTSSSLSPAPREASLPLRHLAYLTDEAVRPILAAVHSSGGDPAMNSMGPWFGKDCVTIAEWISLIKKLYGLLPWIENPHVSFFPREGVPIPLIRDGVVNPEFLGALRCERYSDGVEFPKGGVMPCEEETKMFGPLFDLIKDPYDLCQRYESSPKPPLEIYMDDQMGRCLRSGSLIPRGVMIGTYGAAFLPEGRQTSYRFGNLDSLEDPQIVANALTYAEDGFPNVCAFKLENRMGRRELVQFTSIDLIRRGETIRWNYGDVSTKLVSYFVTEESYQQLLQWKTGRDWSRLHLEAPLLSGSRGEIGVFPELYADHFANYTKGVWLLETRIVWFHLYLRGDLTFEEFDLFYSSPLIQAYDRIQDLRFLKEISAFKKHMHVLEDLERVRPGIKDLFREKLNRWNYVQFQIAIEFIVRQYDAIQTVTNQNPDVVSRILVENFFATPEQIEEKNPSFFNARAIERMRIMTTLAQVNEVIVESCEDSKSRVVAMMFENIEKLKAYVLAK